MRDVQETVIGLLIVVVILSFVGAIAAGTYNIGRKSIDMELKARGLKEYDKQTGRLIWTEKAGGEKGGGK